MRRPTVTVAVEDPTPFHGYLLELAADFLDIEFVWLESPDPDCQVGVRFGSRRDGCGISVPAAGPCTVATVPRTPSHDQYAAAEAPGRVFPFDLVAAVRFWLADEGNSTTAGVLPDEHGRVAAPASAQASAGALDVPLVNAYLLLFEHWINKRLQLEGPASSEQGRCEIVLSHDVDSPCDPSDFRHALRLARSNLRQGQRVLPSIVYGSHSVLRSVAARIQTPGSRHWLFDDITAAEQTRGFTSTFFFAATSKFDEFGCYHDVAYDVRQPEFRQLLRGLVRREVGLGLHIGYRAVDDAFRIKAERLRLEEAAQTSIRGSRHHYWHLSTPIWGSLEAHSRAGLEYDSSIGFNEAPGYRLGAALPFRPWDPVLQQIIPTLQVPTVAMDSMFFRRKPTSVEAAVADMATLLDGLKRFRGTAAIDWHEYTSVPARQERSSWGRAYLELLDLLASDPFVRVVTYEELVDRERPSRLTRVPARS